MFLGRLLLLPALLPALLLPALLLPALLRLLLLTSLLRSGVTKTASKHKIKYRRKPARINLSAMGLRLLLREKIRGVPKDVPVFMLISSVTTAAKNHMATKARTAVP